jgi:hypothetical protein
MKSNPEIWTAITEDITTHRKRWEGSCRQIPRRQVDKDSMQS